MTDPHGLESDSLRAAIRVRTVLAPALLVASILGWGALTLWVFTSDVVSAATLVPLMVLTAGFEAITALHGRAERAWDTVPLSYRQRFAPSGSNALFPVIFFLATVVNYLPAAVSGTVEELAGLGFAHVLFAIRILFAARRAAKPSHGETTNTAPSA
jgi:hypothetical protein